METATQSLVPSITTGQVAVAGQITFVVETPVAQVLVDLVTEV